MSQEQMSYREVDQEQRIFSFKATQFIWLGLVLLEALIAIRIGLKLIGANPDSLFANFIYSFSNIFLFPFEGLVGSPTVGGSVLEISSIIAMLVFALLAWAVERIVWVIFYRPRGSRVDVIETTTSEPVTIVHEGPRE
jgi:hypothetical protein